MSKASAAAGALEALGLTELEAELYACLLRSQGGSVAGLAREADITPRRARRLLSVLEEKGLAVRSVGDNPGYFPTSPDVALQLLHLRREEELREALVTAAQFLKDASVSAGASSDQVVEIIAGREAISRRFQQTVSAAGNDISSFATPPMTRVSEEWTKRKLEILARGVTCRVVYDLEALEAPGIVDFIETVGRAGAHSRITSTLPMPLVIVDRRSAMLPLASSRRSITAEYLLVHESSLLDSLLTLFEATWERSSPFDTYAGQDQATTLEELSAEDRTLLKLLGAGMKETAIARQLGVVPRTVERRLARLMSRLGAHTRFQAALEATRRGWL